MARLFHYHYHFHYHYQIVALRKNPFNPQAAQWPSKDILLLTIGSHYMLKQTSIICFINQFVRNIKLK